jgi:hypothetical protein
VGWDICGIGNLKNSSAGEGGWGIDRIGLHSATGRWVWGYPNRPTRLAGLGLEYPSWMESVYLNIYQRTVGSRETTTSVNCVLHFHHNENQPSMLHPIFSPSTSQSLSTQSGILHSHYRYHLQSSCKLQRPTLLMDTEGRLSVFYLASRTLRYAAIFG